MVEPSSMFCMTSNAKDNSIIEETIKVFQPYYKEPLSNAEALEIHQNFTGFFKLLLRLDKKIKDRKEAEGNDG